MQKRLDLKIDEDVDEIDPDTNNTIQKWIRTLDKKNNTKQSEQIEINEKDFILNFLQKKRSVEGIEGYESDLLPKSPNELLIAQGLSPSFDSSNERRQRAGVWLMMDQDGDGYVQFSEWLALQR